MRVAAYGLMSVVLLSASALAQTATPQGKPVASSAAVSAAPAGAWETRVATPARKGAPAKSAVQPQLRDIEFATPDRILAWMGGYRMDPRPDQLPRAVQAMSQHGLLKDRERAGGLIGFMAGVLGDNQLEAADLVAKMFPIPPDEQTVVVMAIAYAGLPDWRAMLQSFAERMPAQKVVMKKHLDSKQNSLFDVPLDSGPHVLDMLWGHYLATGQFQPVLRIIAGLAWDKETKDLNKRTVAGVAKWTLVANASREKELLDLYQRELKHQPKAVAAALKEVVTAAEHHDAARIRKEATEAIERLKLQNPGEKSKWAWAAQIWNTALAIGCVVANVTGHVEIGVPCIVTGAVSSGLTGIFIDPKK